MTGSASAHNYVAGSIMKELRWTRLSLRRFLTTSSADSCVRHYGLLANRHRAVRLARCRALLDAPAPTAKPAIAPSPAERILQLTGIDILRCPVCGEGPMRRTDDSPGQISHPIACRHAVMPRRHRLRFGPAVILIRQSAP
jgi:hypothetical protein